MDISHNVPVQVWEKKGLIYKPDGSMEWARSHAQLPVSFMLDENTVRVIVSSRDMHHRSLPGYVDLDAANLLNITGIGREPMLGLGQLGEFDDCGVMPSTLVYHEGKVYLYYIGWNVRNTIPYHNAVGLAISEDNGRSFYKFSNGPLWDRDYKEPHYSGATSVLIEDNGVWRIWYLSCTEWRIINGLSEPRYHLKMAESMDGINWIRKGKIAIDYKDDEEAGLTKPIVIKENGLYKMWYCYRKFLDYRTNKDNSYKIGFAISNDGENWQRMDHLVELDVSGNDWDSIMIEYPHVMKIKKELVMFYNGNGFGQSGFGYAVCK